MSDEEIVITRLKCVDCGKPLEQVGVSEFGRCNVCGRKMLFREWIKLAKQEENLDDVEKYLVDLKKNENMDDNTVDQIALDLFGLDIEGRRVPRGGNRG